MDSTKHNRLSNVFKNRKKDDKVMNLFITAGFPAIEDTVDLILGYEKNGADIIELGMPFSDPLADGPTIQFSSEIAIQNGIDMESIFEMVRKVRLKSNIPIVLMGYLNPVLFYGLEPFFKQAGLAGVDGLILPDVPVEESGIIDEFSKRYDVPLIYLVAPNSTDERMKLVDKKSNGFVYCVSVTGVTGARKGSEVNDSVERFIKRVNTNITKNPVLIGFGISSFEDARHISREAHGFVVGSALINNIRALSNQKNWKIKHLEFVHSLKYGTAISVS